MQKISELVQKPSTKNWPTSGGSVARDSRATLLWTRLAEMYGQRWLRDYGDEPTETWVRAVSGLSNDQVRKALTNLAKSGNPHPPTLPEFMSAAIGGATNEHGLNYVPQVYRQSTPMNRMLDKPRDDEAGKAACSEILRMLGRRA